MSKPSFDSKYTYTVRRGQATHMWVVLGGQGAVHLHIRGYKTVSQDGLAYVSGLEFHHPKPPEGYEHDAPHHKECEILGRPCWHDGTSLYAEEHFMPMWKDNPHHHDGMFLLLESEYMRHFAQEDEA